jgi:hypothetical protein
MALTGYTPFVHLDLTYKLTNYPSHTPLSDDRIDGAIWAAFAKWQAVSPFRFSKHTSDSRGDPDIKLSFGNVVDPNAHAETQGHTIVFNDKCTWLDLVDLLRPKLLAGWGFLVVGIWELVDELDLHRPDLLSIAVHEIGHALGLDHNPADASAMTSALNYYKMINVNGSPISQVDIDALNEVNNKLFSAYNKSRGIITSTRDMTTWHKRAEGGFRQVSAGLDNTVWATRLNDQVCEFGPAANERGEFWTPRGENMRSVCVFSAHAVFGVTSDWKLQRYISANSTWATIVDDVTFAAVGADCALWALFRDGRTGRFREECRFSHQGRVAKHAKRLANGARTAIQVSGGWEGVSGWEWVRRRAGLGARHGLGAS